MNRRFIILACGAFILLSAPSLRADTKIDDTMDLVAQFQEKDSNNWLCIIKFKNVQAIDFLVKDIDSDKTYRAVNVGFFTGADWAKFVAAWNKGRNSTPPPEGSVQSLTLGDFLDVNKSMLELSLSPGGTMSFVQIDKDKNLATFELSTGDFKAMNAAIAELSPYFTY